MVYHYYAFLCDLNKAVIMLLRYGSLHTDVVYSLADIVDFCHYQRDKAYTEDTSNLEPW